MKDSLDLSQLALDRSPHGEPTALKLRPQRWAIRYALPFGTLLGFVVLLGVAAGGRLVPTHHVTVVPVIVQRGAVQQAGTTLFQAPGWIEPRPTAVSVAALAPGVIGELLVVEGQSVAKGEPIAKLIAIDAELGIEQAEATLAIRHGELNRARAERDAARVRFDNPVHLQVPLADAQSMLAKTKTELAKIPFLIEVAEAELKFALSSVEGKRAAGDGVARRMVQQAESDHAAARAGLDELRQRTPNLERETQALLNKVEALQKQHVLLIEERRQLEEAEAKVQSSSALCDEAKLQLRQAELTLERNTIRAPMQGRILRLIAAPGTRVMGLDTTAGQNSSTVVEMYDPLLLQVRADVRLEDVPMVIRSQPVEIETASVMGVIHGHVLQTTSSANIQKNTLEVKIELINPPSTVSPEMLVTASFLAPDVDRTSQAPTETQRMYIPNQLIQSDASGSFVWVVDENEDAQRRSVEVGAPRADGLLELKSGVEVTDKLIASGLEGLSSGIRVTVTGDDQTMGIN